MKFSTSVDMALQILVYLAQRRADGLASAPEVSQALQVSYNNVVRIINRLQNAGLIFTRAGRYGGMELALPVEKITVLAIVKSIDGPTKLAPCGHKEGNKTSNTNVVSSNCNIQSCRIREELLQLNTKIDALLESVSIASIVGRQPKGNESVSVLLQVGNYR